MSYVFAGFYPVILEGENKVLTPSSMVNSNVLPYLDPELMMSEETMQDISQKLKVETPVIVKVREWLKGKFEEDQSVSSGFFGDFMTAIEFKELFFSSNDNVKLLGLYFHEKEAVRFCTDFEWEGDHDLSAILKEKVEESEDGEFAGFETIGFNEMGELYSFSNYDESNELINKFALTFNENGLLVTESAKVNLIQAMNAEVDEFDPVKWYWCKVRLF